MRNASRGLLALVGVALCACGGADWPSDGGARNLCNGTVDQTSNGCATVPAGVCGNGIVERMEQCDQGAANSDTAPGACRTNCTLPSCGDSVVDPGEECDEGRKN